MPTTLARRNLRALLDRDELVVAPGVFDGITAHLARRTGQTAAYMTGAGVAASGFGLPDIGLVTGTEMARIPGRNTAARKPRLPGATILASGKPASSSNRRAVMLRSLRKVN